MGALLALASAVCYGLVDFAGGLLSRRIHFAVVTYWGQLGGLFLAVVASCVMPAVSVRATDLFWGALSGVGSAAAMHFLNRGLSRGAMSVVIPVSAVTGVALSVVCGVGFLGDRPTVLAWLGIGVTVPALWLVAGGSVRNGRRMGGPATVDGLIASLGVAVQYVGLAQAAPASGLWPVAAGRLAAIVVLSPSAVRYAGHFRQPLARQAQAFGIGAGAAIGLGLYLLAAQQQMLAIAVVLASLYPAIPTVLGLTVLHEKVTRAQAVGLAGAAGAVVLLTLG
ncbi:EamA family transporter [Streptomyces candidus]|uniref:Drug/metabolite transporter (DMT)-like permease n=1 Tax=Streptomyces candidus TaxID=67283 RepID=A0A7X0LNK3_9ACTN|nr:EamA family transporter [Streptomyces candidus]MBB6434579.1 drug/metabolite transporter (DMT)-like permease [Streptomyces candidus]GHH36198.1 multidrug transporter [Streptomyces candidus]